MTITSERLRQLVVYLPENGVFIWVKKTGRSSAGSVAGRSHNRGYWRIDLDKKGYLAHRLAWLYMTGQWPRNEIDHINHIRNDNRWSNLREATHSQNGQYTGIRSYNTTGYKGIVWHKHDKRWQAQICVNGRYQYLGHFKTAEAAAEAYDIAALVHHGSFAILNFPDQP